MSKDLRRQTFKIPLNLEDKGNRTKRVMSRTTTCVHLRVIYPVITPSPVPSSRSHDLRLFVPSPDPQGYTRSGGHRPRVLCFVSDDPKDGPPWSFPVSFPVRTCGRVIHITKKPVFHLNLDRFRHRSPDLSYSPQLARRKKTRHENGVLRCRDRNKGPTP